MIAWAPSTASLAELSKTKRLSSTCMSWYLNSVIASSLCTFGSYTCTMAPSCINMWHTVSAGVSRTSPVSFLKAKPNTAIFLLVTVLNKLEMILPLKLSFWCSFMSTTCCQYLATAGKPSDSQMYTRFKMSFWKHEPPKPMDALKNLDPMRESAPMALDTSATSAPVFSHKSDIELMLLTRCASTALATNLDNSELHKFVVKTRSLGTQFA
mmetsp:Transcript_53920/g.152790  ORF Transcript_53920/g.152790 Transcript_53920/m.152790 type:complete len:211 (+) Transcript_53920:157-789(+)